MIQQSGMPTGRADAFPVVLDLAESAGLVGDATVVLGVFSDDDTPVEVGFFSLIMLLLTSQHCLDVTPWSEFEVTPVPCALAALVIASSVAQKTEAKWIVLMFFLLLPSECVNAIVTTEPYYEDGGRLFLRNVNFLIGAW